MPRYIDAEKIEYSDFKGDARKFTIESIAYRRQIDKIPTAEVEPIIHAHWIRHGRAEEVEGRLVPNYECSHCHGWFRDNRRRCGECGANMDEK